MNGLNALRRCAGSWQGTNRLYEPPTNTPVDSPSRMTVTPIVGGLFVRVDYTWVWEEKPQEGTYILGCEKKTGVITAYWMDTWHMGTVAMVCRGEAQPDDALNFVGSYAAPEGPDWGWRTVIHPDADGRLHLRMYNIFPEGKEEIAVEATYQRGDETGR